MVGGRFGRSVLSVSVTMVLVALAGCGGGSLAANSAAPASSSTPASSSVPASSSTAASSTTTSTAGCASGAAGTATLITVPKEPDSGVNTISGGCWTGIAPTPIVNSVIGTAPSNVSAWTKVAWSPTDLYVLAWVAEWPLPTSGASLWNGQTVEFYVSGNNTKGGNLGAQDAQFGVMAGSTTVHQGTKGFATMPLGQSTIVQNKGYYAELIVPWSSMAVSAPASGQQYKFDVAADFSDSTGKQVAQTMWVGTQNNYQSTSTWGSIQLG